MTTAIAEPIVEAAQAAPDEHADFFNMLQAALHGEPWPINVQKWMSMRECHETFLGVIREIAGIEGTPSRATERITPMIVRVLDYLYGSGGWTP